MSHGGRPGRGRRLCGLWLGAALATAGPAYAQYGQGRGVAEVGGGYARALFDGPAHHGVVQGGGRLFVGTRVAIGPELVFAQASGNRVFFISGNVTVDLFDRIRKQARVRPYVVVGFGGARQTQRSGHGPYTTTAEVLNVGGGVRIPTRSRWFVAPEYRRTWESQWRTTVTIGRSF